MIGGSLCLNEPPATVAILGPRGTSFQRPGTGQNPGDSSSSFEQPWMAPAIRPAKYRQASTASRAPWVVRELNSRVVPRASPAATPRRAPRYLSISSTQSPIQVVETIGQLDEVVPVLQLVEEPLREMRVAVIRARDRTRHGRHRVRGVAGGHGAEEG